MSELNFRDYYNHIIEVAGNVTYWGDTITDDQMEIVNAYVHVLDASANGLSLDDICDYCFSSDGVAVSKLLSFVCNVCRCIT